MFRRMLPAIIVSAACKLPASAIEKAGVVNGGFHFAADRIPRIDGNADECGLYPTDT